VSRSKKKLPSMMRAVADMMDRRAPPPYSKIDPGIRMWVKTLFDFGVETCQSCEGGQGHAYLEPTIEFLGGMGAGMHALGVALTHGPMPVKELRRIWTIERGEPVGPRWAMVFWEKWKP
jgi:hypothetical protein